ANARIYEAADPFERDNGGLFRLTLPYRIRSQGVISSFSLGALGIRDSSEKIYLGERQLEAGTDYTIDYDVGQVTLLNAETLFLSAPGEELRATWEQKSVFRIAPTSLFGFNTRYDLGERGGVHLLGLHQSEKTLANRPQLGMEPSAITLGGVNGDLHLRAGWLDRLLGRVPGLTPGDSSRLDIVGEMALSLPNPNTRDDVFLDDFDATNYLSLSSRASEWRLGSAPAFRDGVQTILPAFLDQTNATGLVWQHTWVEEGPSGDSTGVFEGLYPSRDIDRQINIVGAESREPVLHFTFGDPGGGVLDQQMWRSVTTVLSNTGMDLTKSEYIEFYAAEGDSLAVVIDLGTVSEDALFVSSTGAVNGVKDETGEQWGLGHLDQEADPRLGEIWSDVADQRGVWEEECVAERGRVYRRGDPRANCTRGNGRNDTEDLDSNGNLGTDERHYRYVIPLDGSSSFVVRSRQETGTQFLLYRIPLRGQGGINVAGRVTEAGWRAVKHLRIIVAGSRSQNVTVARLRIVGARWVKRAQEGILQGISGEVSGVGGHVEVGPVSALTEGSDYQPPPGVLEELDDPTTAFSGQGVEYNEQSLDIRYQDISPGDRVEVYSRFPQRPRNFLTYRQARLWVVAPVGDWGQDRPLHFFLKVGNDSENFYLYRTRLEPSPTEGQVIPADWLPEVKVDFEEWLDLRRIAEERLIRDPPMPGSDPLTVWSADSTYAVVLKDRARAPNLAAVRELSLGVLNEDDLPASGEIWINEFRLSGAVRDPGMAGYLSLDLSAAEVLTSRVTISGRGAFFRQLEAEPSYLDDRVVAVNSTLQLGRFAPSEWGVSLPLVVSHSEADQDPTFLSKSDVRGDQIPGLRETSSSRTRVDLSFRKDTPASNAVLGALLGGFDLRVGYSRARSSTVTLENESDGVDARVGYNRDLPRRDLPVVPGFLGGIVRALLPESMENSVLDGRVRWTPERLSVDSYYFRQEHEALRYEQILLGPEDVLVVPTLSPRRGMESTAAVAFRPFEALTADVSYHSIRDLLAPEKAVRDPLVQALLQEERLELGPLDLGWETNRRLQTRFGFRPRLTSWLRTDLSVATLYSSDRNATLVEVTPTPAGDTVGELQRNANGQRDARLSVTLDPSALVLELVGDTMREVGSVGATLRSVGSAFDPLSFTWQ
ncbi:MAG: hypothetical protein KAJ42_01670, partial [Gemmatimonadetes bacterium]|nr:hypothetical protein [Gemmatimonadota bacterium]